MSTWLAGYCRQARRARRHVSVSEGSDLWLWRVFNVCCLAPRMPGPCPPHLVREPRVLVPRLHELPPDGVELPVVRPQQRAVPGLRVMGGEGGGDSQRASMGHTGELRTQVQVEGVQAA